MHPRHGGNDAARSGWSCRSIWSVSVVGARPVWSRSDGRPEPPRAKLTTYRTEGLRQGRENLEPSAGIGTPGKPPARRSLDRQAEPSWSSEHGTAVHMA